VLILRLGRFWYEKHFRHLGRALPLVWRQVQGLRTWTARKGYALTDEAVENSASETLWCSPHCVPVVAARDLFSEAA
jgi:hypothetical protein